MDVFTRFVCYRQMLMDKRLEFKLDSLSQGVAEICKKVVMSTNVGETSDRLPQVGLLPRVESVSASSSISSAVTSALSEEGDREKQKLNLIMHMLLNPLLKMIRLGKRKTLIYPSRYSSESLIEFKHHVSRIPITFSLC